MGTRSITVFQDEFGKEIVVLYRHFDGYLDVHGKELKDFLEGFNVVNGLPADVPPKTANGMGNLAVQVISHLLSLESTADPAGNLYLMPAGTRDVGEEFTYLVYEAFGTVGLEWEDWNGGSGTLL